MSLANALVALWARVRAAFGRAPEAVVEASLDRASGPALAPAPAKLIIGLGNPGPEYAATRHNIGFRIVERLAARGEAEWVSDDELRSEWATVRIADQVVALLAPQTFMNRSGEALVAALDRWPHLDPMSDVLIVFDDLDLPVGRIRLRPRGGAGGHNGLRDLQEQLGTYLEASPDSSPDLPRLRFGVGRPARGEPIIDWVLGPFDDPSEADTLPEAIERAAEAVGVFVEAGVTAAMQRFNAEK